MNRSTPILLSAPPWRAAAGGPVWLLGAVLLAGAAQAATADDYLRQIQTEAEQQAATPLATKDTTAAGLENTERLPPGLQQDSFEKALRELFIGTYVFYQRLDAQSKDRIYDVYKQNNRVDAIRAQILKLLVGDTP